MDVATSVTELRNPALRRANGCKLQINGWKIVIELQLFVHFRLFFVISYF